MINIDKGRLRLALEIANPDIEVTEIMVDHMTKWCNSQIEIVNDILDGRVAPHFNKGYLQLYRYPTHLAENVHLALENAK